MAGQIKLRGELHFTEGDLQASMSTGEITISVAGTRYLKGIQKVTTSPVALNVGDITANPAAMVPGYILLRNTHATGTLSLRNTLEADFVRVLPGEVAMFRLAVAGVQVIATEELEVEYLVIEN